MNNINEVLKKVVDDIEILAEGEIDISEYDLKSTLEGCVCMKGFIESPKRFNERIRIDLYSEVSIPSRLRMFKDFLQKEDYTFYTRETLIERIETYKNSLLETGKMYKAILEQIDFIKCGDCDRYDTICSCNRLDDIIMKG